MCCCNPSSLLKTYFSQLLNFPLWSETLLWWILSFPILNVCTIVLSERSIVFLNSAYVFSFWPVSLRSCLLKYSKFTWQWSKSLAISIDSIFENSAHSAPSRATGNWKCSCTTAVTLLWPIPGCSNSFKHCSASWYS